MFGGIIVRKIRFLMLACPVFRAKQISRVHVFQCFSVSSQSLYCFLSLGRLEDMLYEFGYALCNGEDTPYELG